MMGPSHVLIALTGAVLIASQTTTDLTEAGILIGGSVATAKLPDIDCKIPGISHRGPATHSLLACLLFAATVAVGVTLAGYPQYALLAAGGMGLGVVLHVLADAMTISGVPALWPAASDVHLLPQGFRFYTGTPDRTKTRPKRCVRCHRLASLCRCGKAEHKFALLLTFGLAGFLWVTYGG